MTFKIAPPFHADHVGSLLRPPRLTAAHRLLKEANLSATEFAAALESAIRELMADAATQYVEGVDLGNVATSVRRQAADVAGLPH